MPFWPLLMGTAAILTAWGVRHSAWQAPALALVGYIGTRLVMAAFPPALHEVAVCTLWLCVAACMMYKGAWVPGFFYTLSAITYPVLLIFGARIGYLAVSSVVADVFAIMALLAIGGGLAGLADARSDSAGPLARLSPAALGVAARKG